MIFTLKDYAPFTNCLIENDNNSLDVGMSMYNLLEYNLCKMAKAIMQKELEVMSINES